MGPKKGGKRRGDSDSEDELVKPAVVVEDKGKGKGKKGKRKGDDSSDDELVKPTPKLVEETNNKKDKKGKSAPEPVVETNNKKGKKGKGKRRDDSSDDELIKPKGKVIESDDDEDEKVSIPEPVKAGKNKSKGGKKGKKDDWSDDELVKPKGKVIESEDEDEEVSIPEPVKAGKTKTKGGKGKRSNDSDDELAIIHQIQEEVSIPEPVKAGKAKTKGGKGKRSNDSDDELAVTPQIQENVYIPEPTKTKTKGGKGKKVEESEEESESEVDDEEETYVPPTPPVIVKKEVKKTIAPVEVKVVAPVEVKVVAPVEVKVVAPVEVKVVAPVEVKVVAPLPTPPPVAEVIKSISSPVIATPVEVVEETKPGKEVKKSKLQLKLEKAKADKKIIDDKKAIEDKIAADELKILQDKEAEEQKAAKIISDQLALEALQNQEDIDDIVDEIKELEIEVPMTEEELEKERRMMATMYGDEVAQEYSVPEEEKKLSRKDEKVSNKSKRKQIKEEESKAREIEYNKAMMKSSAAGKQFAVSQAIVAKDDANWENALDIIIPNFSISAHGKELFYNAECNIIHGRRYGLVAPNGAGKSTLLKMIAAGELKVPPRVDFLYVEQEVTADDTSAVDAVLKADKERWLLVEEEKQLLKHLDKDPDNEKSNIRLGEVYQLLTEIGASSAEANARRILFGLGFDAEMQIRPTKYFSGGWRMRISLARALFMEPTLLMLDEPTNHLDLNAVIWLDDYLQKWKKTLLIVSHDQDFLNSVCQEIIHLDDRKLIYYKGNYDTFKEQEEIRLKQNIKAWEKQEKKIRELKTKGLGMSHKTAEKEQLKIKTREPGARSKKKEAAAVSSGGVESGETKVELIKRPREYTVEFNFPEVSKISPPILEVRDVNFQYGKDLPWLFKGLNFGLDMDSRVCIVGPNGSGKSTIIKLITGECKPPEGEVLRNPRLRVGIYNQHFVDRLPMEEDPVSYLRRLFCEETYQSARNLLGRYGLEGHAHTIAIRDLSGGQKARVVFAELSLMAPHLLFLDEPTNNLDIESIDALCIALKEFNGGIVLVSHDARLIETVECQLWVVEDQNVTPWIEGFDHYRAHLLKKLEEQLNAIMPGSGERPV